MSGGSAYDLPAPRHDAELTEVGRGTPMGELLRRYWHPVGLAADAGSRPRQVRILGEDLILFRDGAGNPGLVRYALRKQMAVRHYRRSLTVGDVDGEVVNRMLREADCTRDQAEEIYRLTSLCSEKERFVIPPAHREEAIEMIKDPQEHREAVGFGFLSGPKRGL